MLTRISIPLVSILMFQATTAMAEGGSSGTTGGGDSYAPIAASLPQTMEITTAFRWPDELFAEVNVGPKSYFGVVPGVAIAQELLISARYALISPQEQTRLGGSNGVYRLEEVRARANEKRGGTGRPVDLEIRPFTLADANRLALKHKLTPAETLRLVDAVDENRRNQGSADSWLTLNGSAPFRLLISNLHLQFGLHPVSGLHRPDWSAHYGYSTIWGSAPIRNRIVIDGSDSDENAFAQRLLEIADEVAQAPDLHSPVAQADIGQVLRGLAFLISQTSGDLKDGLLHRFIREVTLQGSEISNAYFDSVRSDGTCDEAAYAGAVAKEQAWPYKDGFSGALTRMTLPLRTHSTRYGSLDTLHESITRIIARAREAVRPYCEEDSSDEGSGEGGSDPKAQNLKEAREANTLTLGDFLQERVE